MPTVYVDSCRYDITDSAYREWLRRSGFLFSVDDQNADKPTLRLDDEGRRAAALHIAEGQNGELEMAVPLEQTPPHVEEIWAKRERLAAQAARAAA